MFLSKIFILFLICFSLQAARPLSGLNTKDFFDVQKTLTKWQNNPFIQRGDTAGIDELVLFAIVYNKDNAAALINNQIVKTGDKIGSLEVVSIEKQQVILRNENGVFKLSFKRKKNEKL